MSNLCSGYGAPTPTGEWPDLDLVVPCCESSAIRGPETCTCWEPVYDLEQQPIDEAKATALADADIAPPVRTRMCGDCAYRPGSPEKTGDQRYTGDATTLEDLAREGRLFWCHIGMRQPVRWRHPSGAEIPAAPDDYVPVIRDGVPYKADGQPGEVCAGFDARRRALAAATTGVAARLPQPKPGGAQADLERWRAGALQKE